MTISEVSKKYDITADTLRYYERIGLIPPVPRTKSGLRDYDESSCNWVNFIKCMRSAGLQIEALIEYVKLFQMGDETIEARKQLLIEQKELLEEKQREIASTLDRLNYKIENYDRIVKNKKMSYLMISYPVKKQDSFFVVNRKDKSDDLTC